MEHLSIEEKAKRYDEAIEIARKIANGEPINVPDGTPIPLAIFPELAESEDEKIRKSLLWQYKGFKSTDYYDDGITFGDVVKWLEKQGEQKPVEWSEEDEKRVESLHGWLDTLVNYIHHDTIVSLDLRRERMQQVERLKTWLKSLKERVQPQPKQGWSEDDERKFSDISALLRGGENCHYNTPDLFDFLKSLKDRYTWKPSDEQMDALNLAIGEANSVDTAAGDEAAEILSSLYEQLKKLREE